MFKLKKTIFEDAFVIENFFFKDDRGSFMKIFEKDLYEEIGIEFSVNETIISKSKNKVIRGLHFQSQEPQAKIVACIYGGVWDVIVDLRSDSQTYSMWQSFNLNDVNNNALFVPRGFAHGFLSRVDNTALLYLCDGKYNTELDSGIRFDDPDIGIEWPINITETIHSERDLSLQSFKAYQLNPMKKSL